MLTVNIDFWSVLLLFAAICFANWLWRSGWLFQRSPGTRRKKKSRPNKKLKYPGILPSPPPPKKTQTFRSSSSGKPIRVPSGDPPPQSIKDITQ